MPISLTGAVGMLWTNVLVNDHGGLGTVFPLIMDLKILEMKLFYQYLHLI